MLSEPLPWDRKHFFKERKHESWSEPVRPFWRWREAPHHHVSSSSRNFARWEPAEFRSRTPGADDKPFVKAVNIDNYSSNLGGLSQNHVKGWPSNLLENLELTPIDNLSSSISEFLQSNDPGSVDFSFVKSTAMNKLLVWKGDISKALEMTESKIDSLENELKSLVFESGNQCALPVASSSLQSDRQAKPCEDVVVAPSSTPQPALLQLVSSGGLEEECFQVRDEDINNPGAVTSGFVEAFSSGKAAALSDPLKHGDSSGDSGASKSRNLEIKCSMHGSNEEKEESFPASDGGGQLIASKSSAAAPLSMKLHCKVKGILCNSILASNRDSARRASEVFNRLLPSDKCDSDVSSASSGSSWPNDPLIMEKFAMRKHFLKFKERVITLKFRAFQHIWKEDVQLLSVRKYRAKSQKRMELSSRSTHGSYQKFRSSIRSHFSSPEKRV